MRPEQQAQVERAAEMLEGYAAHLYKLSPFNPDEHPYIPSIQEAAEEMRGLAKAGASCMVGITSKDCDFCEGAGGWGSGEDAEGCTKCNSTGKASAADKQ